VGKYHTRRKILVGCIRKVVGDVVKKYIGDEDAMLKMPNSNPDTVKHKSTKVSSRFLLD